LGKKFLLFFFTSEIGCEKCDSVFQYDVKQYSMPRQTGMIHFLQTQGDAMAIRIRIFFDYI